jgi:hypothetical protein
MKHLFILFVVLFFITNLKAQDIFVAVKKGAVTINDATVTSKSLPKKVTKNTRISSKKEAILLINKGSKYNKIYCPCEELSYADITKKLSQQPVKGNSSTQVIFNKPLEKEGGAQKGSVSRGGNGEQDFYINIEDSAVIFNASYSIEWKTPFQITYSKQPELLNLETKLTQQLSSNSSIETATLVSGWYELSFEGQTVIDSKLVSIKLRIPFQIPTPEQKELISAEIEELKAATIDLGEDIFEIYLNEYLLSKHILGF